MLQARVNFKGVEKSFFKLLFTGHSFKVSFRNVFLLVVTSTLFEVALGHRRLQGPFFFLARLGFLTCRTMQCLGVFDDAFLYGFVWLGLFFLLQGDMYGPSLHPVVRISIPRRYYA